MNSIEAQHIMDVCGNLTKAILMAAKSDKYAQRWLFLVRRMNDLLRKHELTQAAIMYEIVDSKVHNIAPAVQSDATDAERTQLYNFFDDFLSAELLQSKDSQDQGFAYGLGVILRNIEHTFCKKIENGVGIALFTLQAVDEH